MYTEADMPVASAQDMREEEPVQEVSYEMESYTLSGGKGATAKKNKKAEDPALKEKKQQRAQFVEKVFNEVFWPRYPRKVHKKKAKECFEKLFTINIPKEQCTRRLRNIMARLEQLIAENRPIDKIPYPSTFLNAEDFDEAPESDITLAMEVSMQ